MAAKITEEQRLDVATRRDDGTFGPGNSASPGRPPGAKNKITKQRIEEAHSFFSPLLGNVKSIIAKHFEDHKAGPDCATCRHYVDIVVQYVFGKPPQRVDIQLQDARAEAERIADELGLPEEEKAAAVAEVEALLSGR
jgi:hypothetical protein